MIDLSAVTGGIIISCQAPPGNPLRDPHIMAQMARAAELGGAVAIRAEGHADITEIKRVTDLPVVGLRKHRRPDSELHITTTCADVDLVASSGAEVVALDGSPRPRPGGETLEQVVAHAKSLGLWVMADLNLVTDASRAVAAGCDLLATTQIRPSADDVWAGGPNIRAIHQLTCTFPDIPVIAEGRYATAADVRLAFHAGAAGVVIGTAATNLLEITRRLAKEALSST